MLLKKIQDFTATLDREEFYAFYGLMTALSSPACGDYLQLGTGALLNLKKIVRRMRITVMTPRFNVDYAAPYTADAAWADMEILLACYGPLPANDKNAVAKVIVALRTIAAALEESK